MKFFYKFSLVTFLPLVKGVLVLALGNQNNITLQLPLGTRKCHNHGVT